MSGPSALFSPLLAAVPGVRHAFFTRHGGVSKGIYASLNLGRGSRDDPGCVLENRRRATGFFDLGVDALNTCYQIHSNRVLVADRAWNELRPRADGLVTNRAGLICGALSADCAPVLMADGGARIVGAVHAGWRGALAGVLENAVEAMVEFGATPETIMAAVGPCIAQDSYQVGLDFVVRFELGSPGAGRFFSAANTPDRRQFDLPAFVLSRLQAAGVTHSEWIGGDTYAEADRFFSNRRAFHRGEEDYGRLLSAVVLDP